MCDTLRHRKVGKKVKCPSPLRWASFLQQGRSPPSQGARRPQLSCKRQGENRSGNWRAGGKAERQPPLHWPVDKPPLTAEGTGPAMILRRKQHSAFVTHTYNTHQHTHGGGSRFARGRQGRGPPPSSRVFHQMHHLAGGLPGPQPWLISGNRGVERPTNGEKAGATATASSPHTHEISQGWRGAPRQSLATPKRLGGNNIQQTTSGRIEFRPGPVMEPVRSRENIS